MEFQQQEKQRSKSRISDNKSKKQDRARSKSQDSINSESDEDTGSSKSEASQEKLFELLSVDSFEAASDYNEEEMERLVKM